MRLHAGFVAKCAELPMCRLQESHLYVYSGRLCTVISEQCHDMAPQQAQARGWVQSVLPVAEPGRFIVNLLGLSNDIDSR
jgi:hypothetical protein